MRASGEHRKRFVSHHARGTGLVSPRLVGTLGVLALSLGLVSSSGCAKRYILTPQEFERIEKREAATEDLRVYVSKKLIVIYELEDDKKTYVVDRDIKTSSEENIVKVTIARNTRGLIVDVEDRNGAPLLWVSFNPKCTIKDCAFGFVQTEDSIFRLHSMPEREGYKKPRAYFKRFKEKKRMGLGKLKSLAEKNEVYLWKNWREKIFTIDLIVKKRTVKKIGVTREKPPGVK